MEDLRGLGLAGLRQGHHESPIRLFALELGPMPLEVSALMQGSRRSTSFLLNRSCSALFSRRRSKRICGESVRSRRSRSANSASQISWFSDNPAPIPGTLFSPGRSPTAGAGTRSEVRLCQRHYCRPWRSARVFLIPSPAQVHHGATSESGGPLHQCASVLTRRAHEFVLPRTPSPGSA